MSWACPLSAHGHGSDRPILQGSLGFIFILFILHHNFQAIFFSFHVTTGLAWPGFEFPILVSPNILQDTVSLSLKISTFLF